MTGAQDLKTKKAISDAQIANYQSEIEARKLASVKDQRQQSLIESFFPGMYGGNQSSGGSGGPSMGAQTPMSPGAYAPSSDGNGPVMPRPAAPQNDMLTIAKGYGIPEQAIQSDMVFNGGKGIAAMLEKHGARDMQINNGYAYDKNKVGAGFMPSLSTSQTGQTSMTQIGPDGMPIISAPQGAMDTYSQYKGVDALLAAGGKINLRKNADGTEAPVSELTENPTLQKILSGLTRQPGIAAPTGAPAGYATEPQMKATVGLMGGEAASNLAGIQREIRATQNDLMKPLDPASKAMLQAQLVDLQKQAVDPRNVAAAQNTTSTGTPAYGMTNQQAAQAKGQESAASALGAKAGDILKDSADTANSAVMSIQSAQRIQDAIGSGKVLSGMGASFRMGAWQLADTVGIAGKNEQEKIANTRQVIQDFAKLSLEGRAAMRGQGAISDRETALAVQATSGNIDSMTGPEIMQLANAAERTARFKYAQHDTKMNDMSGDPSVGNLSLYKAAPLPEARKTVVKTGMYGGKKVVQYSDGSTAYAN